MDKDLLYTLRWYLNHWDADSKKEALKIMSVLLEERTPGKTIPKDTRVIPPGKSGPSGRVAVVIGHNSKNKGAYAKGDFNQFEYEFNGDVAKIIAARAWNGLDVKIFRRWYSGSYASEIKKVYSSVNAWNPDFVLELHFNSSPGGYYSFMLYHHASSKSKAVAKIVNDTFIAATGFASKQQNAAKKSGDRGYLSLASARAPAVLTEPFFESNSSHMAKINSLGHSGMANLYLDAIRNVLAAGVL